MIRTFDMKALKTRKIRNWVAYAGQGTFGDICIQSDDAIGKVWPDDTGILHVNKSGSGAHFVHLVFAMKTRFPTGTYAKAKTAQPIPGETLSKEFGIIQVENAKPCKS